MQIGMMVYDLPGAFERSGDMPLLRERIYTIEDIYALPEGDRWTYLLYGAAEYDASEDFKYFVQKDR